MGELICARCENAIDPMFQGGYVEQVCLGRIRVPYHRACWNEGEQTGTIATSDSDSTP